MTEATSASPGGSLPSAAERRVWVRCKVETEPTCRLAARPDPPLETRVRDISPTGISLLVKRPFERGTTLIVEFPDVPPVEARVLHVTSKGQSEWALGCQFARELAWDDVRAHVVRPAPDNFFHRRDWQRCPCVTDALYQVAATGATERRPAKVVDICPSGVGLLVDQAVAIGELLNLELPGTTPVSIAASVVRVSPGDSPKEWALGCIFLGELGEADLEALR